MAEVLTAAAGAAARPTHRLAPAAIAGALAAIAVAVAVAVAGCEGSGTSGSGTAGDGTSGPDAGARPAACKAPRPGAGREAPIDAPLDRIDPDIGTLLTTMIADARETPDDGSLRGRLGMAYEVASLEDAAQSSYVQAIDLEPAEPRWHYYYALELAREGDLQGALDRLDCVGELAPDYAPAQLYRGQWSFDLGRDAQALAAYRRATELEPGNPAGGMGEARILLNQGKNDEALARLLDLGARFNHPYLQQLIGRAYRQKGELERAQEVLRASAAGSVPPGWPDPWNDEKLQYRTGFSARLLQAGKLMSRGQAEQAVRMLEQLHAERPEDVATINNLSVAYVQLRRDDDALRLLEDAVRRFPAYFPFHLNLADLYMRRDDPSGAMRHLDRATELNPTLSHAWEQKGGLLLRQRRLDEALAAMEKAIAYDARDPNTFLTAAVLAFETKRHERAMELARQAVELNPSSGPAHLVLASAEIELGRFGDARAHLDRAEALGTNPSRISRARARLGQLDPEG